MSETVYIASNSNCYHISKDCRGLSKGYKSLAKWDRDMAEAWGKEMCQYCSGEFSVNREQDGKWPV